LRNRLVFFGLRGRLGGFAELLKAPQLGQGAEIPPVLEGDAARHLKQGPVGGRVFDEGGEVGGFVEELGFDASPAVLAPLGKDEGLDEQALDGALGLELREIVFGEGRELLGILAANDVGTNVEAEGRRDGLS